jgi:MFS family permease
MALLSAAVAANASMLQLAGFALGAVSCGLAALGSAYDSAVVVLLGLTGVGLASGPGLLIRTAGGDMYPPERRARGIALVLFGAVCGAILGPAVFGPLVSGRELDGDALAALLLAGGAFDLVALGLVAAVRPDPKVIASRLGYEPPAQVRPAAPLGALLRRRGVVPALLAAQMSLGAMVAVMTLTGPVLVDHFHQEHSSVFPIIGAHFLGMYALVIVVGDLVDRIGRAQSLAGGLLLMGLSVSSLLWLESAHATGAALTLVGGAALTAAGVGALAIGAMVLVLAPALWILRAARPLACAPDCVRSAP